MNLLSIPAAAEILDATPRHVGELIEAGELSAVDIACHAARPGKTIGTDGRIYNSHKRRLRVTAESVRDFISRRATNQPKPAQRRKPDANIITFF